MSMMSKFIVGIFALFLFVSSNVFASKVIELNMEGVIHDGTVHVVQEALEKAKSENAQALLIVLDTPGGVLESTRKIVKLFLNEETIPVIVYVSPMGSRAGSAGTFITLAAHVAAMSPGTHIGAAHPVTATGKDPEEGGKHMAEKIENDTIAFIESIAAERHRNAEWAKKAVLNSASIGEQEAQKTGVIDVIAPDVKTLLKQIDGKKIQMKSKEVVLQTNDATIVPFVLDLKTKLLNLLADPSTIMILMTIIGLGIYVEFSHPGLILPAVASIISIFLLLIATNVIPITLVGSVLIFCGFLCFMFEIFVVSYGFLTIVGLGLFIAGSTLLFDPTTSDLKVSHAIIWSISLGVAIIAAIIAYSVTSTVKQPPAVGLQTLIGNQTKLVQEISIHQDGKIFAQGSYWTAKSDDPIDAGHDVVVVGVNGLTVHVKKVI